ncbi:hypothetical protein AUR64_03005 [Haloprofundus marisrubri]|uniref:MBL fold metallo-hydrolase n=1 Tax=Haloprofundus marisrubri TaxID=1514971 RepID=A0A0W1R386_9EURY|nr:hypothetical protein [Haloprofundus marisrubri]KTG07642.1 hypothetical protein AUR64_03005 [Haloprofundus marisrubri]
MTMFDRSDSNGYRVVDRWDGGVGWLAYPDEAGQRASHLVVGDDGVWLFDPLDAPGVNDLISEFGSVAGVAVFSDYHARDADVFAERYGVPVSMPPWMKRLESRLDAPVDRYTGPLGESGFSVRRYTPFPGWAETLAYRESDRTLYIPEVLGTAPIFTVADERIGVYLLQRPRPPSGLFEGYDPDRLIVGHGTGVFDDASAALDDALAGARRRLPTALVQNGLPQVRALVEALGP